MIRGCTDRVFIGLRESCSKEKIRRSEASMMTRSQLYESGGGKNQWNVSDRINNMFRYIETRNRRVIKIIWLEVGHKREGGSNLEEILHHNKEFVLGMTETINLYY